MINKNIFLVKNLFNYEIVVSPPNNLPDNFETVYVTDNDVNCDLAKNLGWGIVKKVEDYLHVTDKFQRRQVIGFINSFPHKVCPEVIDYKFVFVCDSNIIRLWDEYTVFTSNCTSDNALFITSGYYSNSRDTIMSERDESTRVSRWSYNRDEINSSTEKYISELKENNVDLSTLSVVSAKYIGWNLRHKDYDLLSNKLYSEYSINLQGNIILTYMSGLFPNGIYNFHTKKYEGGRLNSHRYEA
tara:strand:- start:127 stop:855 length:729 start_codon:yes stop_codon:yes gene_type:complete